MVVNIYYANYCLPPKHSISGKSKTDVCRGRGVDLMDYEDPIHCQKGMSLRVMNRDSSLSGVESKSDVRSVTFTREIVTIPCSQRFVLFFLSRILTSLLPYQLL